MVSRRRLVRCAPCLLLALAMASCRENVVGVGGAAGNRLAVLIAPQLSATARAELQTLTSTTGSLGDLHIHVTRPPSAPLDTVVPFAAGSNSTLFTMNVELESATEQVVITLTLDVDTTVYYAGSQTVAVREGATVVAPSIVMSYVGPVAAVSVTPANASVRAPRRHASRNCGGARPRGKSDRRPSGDVRELRTVPSRESDRLDSSRDLSAAA